MGESELMNEFITLEKECQSLIDDLDEFYTSYPKVVGINKIKRKIKAEQNLMQSVIEGKTAPNQNFVNCSNITHFRAIVKKIKSLGPRVTSVMKIFRYSNQKKSLEVDIVADDGAVWFKVKAMKAQTIQLIHEGHGYYGHKGIVESCNALVECAKENMYMYEPPKIIVDFTNGITTGVYEDLKKLGIEVTGILLDSNNDKMCNIEENTEVTTSIKEPTILNFDVTTLIYLASDVTNGGCYHYFEDPIIAAQAEKEREEASLPKFLEYIEGKELVVTETAVRHFESIMNIIAGEGEKKRAYEWLSKIKIIPDDPSERSLKLSSSKITDEHRIIFGTGDKLKAITTTGNISFIRSAQQQGVSFSVYIHPSRAFTEQKIIRRNEYPKSDNNLDS